ncbi:MAG TPA: gamma carbonic anhydrase family protein [Methylomirabilota bacterium]|jgi:carbonic anhydrase/acetyltransferase-like protein (isoleucine patch superfamily)|nr:gamma carbonic anhydrase family protein [Methylomirabilota bacterium]
MPLYSFEGRRPRVHPETFIAPTATLVGDVSVEAGASIWYGAVLRGDFSPILVRAGANVQDGAVVHTTPTGAVEIGPGATVAHLCVIHAATLEEECLVGNGAIVLDGARIGARSLVAAGAVVPAGMMVPPGMLAAGVPAEVKRALGGTAAERWVQVNPSAYQALARRHRAGVALLAE